jgi:hypothetical protein
MWPVMSDDLQHPTVLLAAANNQYTQLKARILCNIARAIGAVMTPHA